MTSFLLLTLLLFGTVCFDTFCESAGVLCCKVSSGAFFSSVLGWVLTGSEPLSWLSWETRLSCIDSGRCPVTGFCWLAMPTWCWGDAVGPVFWCRGDAVTVGAGWCLGEPVDIAPGRCLGDAVGVTPGWCRGEPCLDGGKRGGGTSPKLPSNSLWVWQFRHNQSFFCKYKKNVVREQNCNSESELWWPYKMAVLRQFQTLSTSFHLQKRWSTFPKNYPVWQNC